MNKVLIPVVFVSVMSALLVAGCVEQPVGGQRDEHGCLGPAGYSWNASIGACIREWELNDNQKQAAKIAVDRVGRQTGLTVTEVTVARCPGCFVVNFDLYGSRSYATLADWSVVSIEHGSPYEEPAEVNSFEQCVAAGYPVMESYPRVCRTPDGRTFTETIELNSNTCAAFGGHWNECSSRCQIDNAGRNDVACPAMCEALCECGGIAGYICPSGYECRMPSGIADALGYCVMAGSAEEQPEQTSNEPHNMTVQECLDMGGRTVNIVGGDTCDANETNAGAVTGFISPNICCMPFNSTMTQEEAVAIAMQSVCINDGTLTENVIHNEYTHTWWIDMIPDQDHPGCSPACVVSEETGSAEINWRCTGLITE